MIGKMTGIVGDVSVAPVGTRLPASPVGILDRNFRELGYLDELGVRLTRSTASFTLVGSVPVDTDPQAFAIRTLEDDGMRRVIVVPRGEIVDVVTDDEGLATSVIVMMTADDDGKHLYIYTEEGPLE